MTDPAIPDVEITDVQATQVDANRTWTFVRIYTDAGIVGDGEAYWGPGVSHIINQSREFLVGKNPCNIDKLLEDLVNGFSPTGSIGGASVTAISGIDLALHDLAGKILEVPAYQLLGGKYRDEVRTYCDTHAGAHSGSEDEAEGDIYSPEAYADAAEDVLDDGWDALKFDLDASRRYEKDEYNRHLDAEAIEYKSEIVRAVTERVGHQANVAFDCHWNYTGDSAIRLGKAIEDYDVWWLEDPVPPENLDVHREVTRETDVSICAGENLYRTQGTRQLVEEQGVDIIQPDMPKYGGMRETVKLANQAKDYYIPMALHNVSLPLGTMAGAHVATAVPNFLALEFHSRDDPEWENFVEEDHIIEDGYIEVPNKPGLGLTVDIDMVDKYKAEGETLFDEA